PLRHTRAARRRRPGARARHGACRRRAGPPPRDRGRHGDAARRRLREGARRGDAGGRGPARDAGRGLMPVFAYRALSGGGRARGGVIGAESARAAWQELRARGVYPTELREQAAGTGWAGRRLGAEELAAATRQLATLVGAGPPGATVAELGVARAWGVPQLPRVFAEAGTRIPRATRLLNGVTSVVGRTWWLLRLAGAGAAWGLARWAATPAGRARLDGALLGAPLAGPIVRKAAVARFARTLGTLLAGGLPPDAGLGLAGPATGTRRRACPVSGPR